MVLEKKKFAARCFLAAFLVFIFMLVPSKNVFAKTITVRFYSPAGTEYRQYRKKVKAGKKISLPEVPERSLVCYGWSTKKQGRGKIYESWTRKSFKKNTKLYALVWSENRDRTKNQEKIWKAANHMNKSMVTMNRTYPGTWHYSNYNVAGSFKKALQTGRYQTDCSRGVSWVIKQAGLNRDRDYKRIELNGSYTVGRLLYNGYLTCGDVIDYQDFSHTNMYLGQNIWFDSGHYNCVSSTGEVPFKRWIGYKGQLSKRVRRIWRLKK